MDESIFVTEPTPIDLTGVRDAGMQALIIIAVSLGWNVMKKHNQPVVLTARDGTQKRLPTNTSVRMSVFQTALSTIMLHSGDMEPTIELIDAVVRLTKPSRDHERRLRLAVGETPAEHRSRIAAAEAEPPDIPQGEHLTQRVAIPPEFVSIAMMEEAKASVALDGDTQSLREGLMVPPAGPADGEVHGELISREPFLAHYSGGGDKKGSIYESMTSYERIWEDEYRDYECQVCGRAFPTPRGVGAHRQTHTKAGEVEPDSRFATERQRQQRQTRQARAIEFVDELPPEEVATQVASPPPEPPISEPEHEITSEIADDALTLLDAIAKLMQPRLARQYEERIAELITERDEARKRLAEIEGEFDALVELLQSRKRT